MIPFHTQLKQINRNKLILLEHEIMFLKTLTTYRQVYLKHGYTNHKDLTNNQPLPPPHPHPALRTQSTYTLLQPTPIHIPKHTYNNHPLIPEAVPF